MSEPRSKRVAISFTESEHTALQTMAQRQRVPVSKLLAQIARSHLALEHADPPAHPEAPAAAEPDLPSVAGERPIWLPPVAKSALAQWARSRAAAVQALIDRGRGGSATESRRICRLHDGGSASFSWWICRACSRVLADALDETSRPACPTRR